jgi:hypothetical protein
MIAIRTISRVTNKKRQACNVLDFVRVWLLIHALFVLILGTARAQVSSGGGVVEANDWDEYLYMGDNFSPQVPFGAFMWDQYDYTNSYDLLTGNHSGQIDYDYTAAGTDWINPFYLTRTQSAYANYYYAIDADLGQHGYGLGTSLHNDGQPPHLSISVSDSLDCIRVNEEIQTYMSAAVYHEIGTPDWPIKGMSEFWDKAIVMEFYAIGENPSVGLDNGTTGSGSDYTVQTNADAGTNMTFGAGMTNSPQSNSGAVTYQMVQVPPITLAFIGTNAPLVNLAPLPGCTGGGVFKDVRNPPVYAYLYYSHEFANTGSNNVDLFPQTGTNVESFGQRFLRWYGPYADSLNASATGLSADSNGNEIVARDSNTLAYYTSFTNGDVIGQLVTYAVVPAHPDYDTNIFGLPSHIGFQNYAFEVAMQLGPVMATNPIYSGTSSSNSPPVVSGPAGGGGGGVGIPIYPPSFPGPGGPIIIPVGTTSPIVGIIVTDSNLTGDIEADITAQDGILTLGTTNGLDSISGNGTSSVSIQGSVANSRGRWQT